MTSGNLFVYTQILHEYSFSFPIHTAYFCNIFQNRHGTLKGNLTTMERKFTVLKISSDLLVFLRITKVCWKMGIWTLTKSDSAKIQFALLQDGYKSNYQIQAFGGLPDNVVLLWTHLPVATEMMCFKKQNLSDKPTSEKNFRQKCRISIAFQCQRIC